MISLGAKTLEDMKMDTSGMEMWPVTVLGDYRKNGGSGVIDAGTFTAEQTKAIVENGRTMVNAMFDGWRNPELTKAVPLNGNACTCLLKKLDDGSVIMGRNMDLPVSFAPAVIFRTKGNGKNTYDTVNLAYSSPGTISFDQVAELGAIPTAILTMMMNGCTDSVNSEGLYTQFDMREATLCPTESTNPNSNTRVCCISLVRMLGDHCATIAEALEYLKTLDIYDPKSIAFNWGMAVGMMDKTGRYGVLEFYNNKIKWLEGRPGFACGHANFFWSENEAKAHHGAGLGRWEKLMQYYYSIENQKDMAEAMSRIWYSNLYTSGAIARNWKTDWISEANDTEPYPVTNNWLSLIYNWRDNYGVKVDEKHLKAVLKIEERQKKEGGPVWTREYLQDPAHYYDVITVIDLVIKCFAQLPIDAQKASGLMEISSISYTATNKEIGYNNHFFETDDLYHIGLYETKIDRHPNDRKVGKI